jgi:SMC interacting uncharacterized protein involved in chromosome segregation
MSKLKVQIKSKKEKIQSLNDRYQKLFDILILTFIDIDDFLLVVRKNAHIFTDHP